MIKVNIQIDPNNFDQANILKTSSYSRKPKSLKNEKLLKETVNITHLIENMDESYQTSTNFNQDTPQYRIDSNLNKRSEPATPYIPSPNMSFPLNSIRPMSAILSIKKLKKMQRHGKGNVVLLNSIYNQKDKHNETLQDSFQDHNYNTRIRVRNSMFWKNTKKYDNRTFLNRFFYNIRLSD